jgi:hypothetical protein
MIACRLVMERRDRVELWQIFAGAPMPDALIAHGRRPMMLRRAKRQSGR